MKKIVLIVSIILISCSKNTADEGNPVPPTLIYEKPEKGDLSLPSFTQPNPQYSIEGDYLYFDFPSSVRFEGDIEGFTKVDHNVFTANESKDYKTNIKFGGHYVFDENNVFLGFALEVKINDSSRYLTSDITTSNPTNRELILELNKGDKISFRICIRVTTPPKIKFLQNGYLEINVNELSSTL